MINILFKIIKNELIINFKKELEQHTLNFINFDKI